MSVQEMSLYFLGGVPIQYFGLDPIAPGLVSFKMLHAKNNMGCRFCSENNDKTQADYWKRMTVT